MEDSYNSIYKVGDRLIIELNMQQTFEGDYSDGGKNRIDLVNVKQHNNSNELGGVYSFYRNEIIKIYKYKSEGLDNQETTKMLLEDCNNIRILEDEFYRLKNMCLDTIYLDQVDEQYFKSVEKLREAETVAIIFLGTDKDPTNILLVICTWKQIYILDLRNFRNGTFYPEIKDILESEYITKVMHGGSALINILYRSYNVHIQNIFDTQVVDLILEKSIMGSCPKITIDISQCLVKYLNFPPSLLKDALSVSKKNWMERPLTQERKFFASQFVVYLIPLKDYMKKKLLCKVYKAIEDVHNLYYHLDNYEFSHLMQNNNITEKVRDLIPMLKTEGENGSS